MKIPFVQAKHFIELPVGQKRNQLIVIHSMEAPEKGTTAEAVARYFQNVPRRASTQYCIDNNSVVQCVQCKDVCYGAPHGNRHGIHIEHAGYAKQKRDDWLDEYSLAMLRLSAKLCSEILMPKFNIPMVWLDDVALRKHSKDSSIRGFCTHADLTRAFAVKGGHTDPGAGFPRDVYARLVLGKPI